MGSPAFREGDATACTNHGAGFGLFERGSVRVNSRTLLVVGSGTNCNGTPSRIARGAANVTFNGRYCARVGDVTADSALLLSGSPNVNIGSLGSNSAGGCPAAMTAICQAMRAGRHPPPGSLGPIPRQIKPGGKGQSYHNCGLESCRQLIFQATGNPVDEDTILDHAIDKGYTRHKVTRVHSGSIVPKDEVKLLEDYGVEAETFRQTPESIAEGVESGKGVSVSLYADILWEPNPKNQMPSGAHGVVVTGVERDAQGRIVAFIINDTGELGCGARVEAAHFHQSLMKTGVMTKKPIW